MALLKTDGKTVGLYPLPDTAIRLGELGDGSGAGLIPAGVYEFKPVIPPKPPFINELLSKVGQLPEKPPVYISPYDTVLLPVTAIPTFPNEYISGMTITGPIACMLEDPLPVLEGIGKTLRSLAETLRIGISPWWAPGLFFEPFVNVVYPQPYIPPAPVSASPSGTGPGYLSYTANIQGYYTDRNWTDREWILKEADVVGRYNINGRFTKPAKKIKYPLNPRSIRRYQPSAITPYTFFSTNILTSACAEEVMLPYIRCAEHIIQYKPSEIRAMRFYFLVVIDSVIYPSYVPPFQGPPPSIILKTPFVAHMTVDSQHDWMSIFKLLCSHKLVTGPCMQNRVYEDLNDVPEVPPGDPNVSAECYTTDKDFSEYNQELLDMFDNFVETNTIEKS